MYLPVLLLSFAMSQGTSTPGTTSMSRPLGRSLESTEEVLCAESLGESCNVTGDSDGADFGKSGFGDSFEHVQMNDSSSVLNFFILSFKT